MSADLPADPAPPIDRRVSWLGPVAAGLVAALLAVAVVQTRQFTLLRQALDAGDDRAAVAVYQAETEYLLLRERWRAAADASQPFDATPLRGAWRDWTGGLAPLKNPSLQRWTRGGAAHQAVLQPLQGFVAAADGLLGSDAGAEPSREAVAELLPALLALGEPLHALSAEVARGQAAHFDQRAQTVQAQTLLSVALTVFLSMLTLAFAAIALRQLRQLRERRLALEELAASLRQARRDAESASAAKSAFLANMSHEIRTPFHGLMGMLSLLRETGLTPRQIDYLRTATESADHLLALLNDILDMSQLESGRMTLVPAPMELRAMLREVEALMRPQAHAKSLALHIDADPAVPERMLADATRLKQIVLNLLSNAIKFSDRGAVVLDVRCVDGDADGRLLELVVTDTGIGMDEDTRAGLFNRFVQGDRTPSRRHAGSGLGLEISRNLARLMGGDITVRSRPGEGSCFTVRVPLQALPDAPAPEQAADAGGTRPLQVLVAEDHPVNRQYIAALLENLGHDAHFTTNGREAVQALQDRRFDLVLMDLHMPVMDGVAATRAIRALPDPATSTVPIVALTADALAETRDRCLVAGMNGFLTKPVSPQKLATALRRLFGGAGPAELPAQAGGPAAPSPARGGAQPLVDAAAVHMSLQAMPAEKLGTMIGAFLDQAPETVQRLRAAVRDAQPLELRVNAHAAKGAALNLGLTGLAATAEALQEGASHLPAHEIARLVQRFDDQLRATRKAAAAMGLLDLATESPARP